MACDVGNARVLVNSELCGFRRLLALDTSREGLLQVFTSIRDVRLAGNSYAEIAKNCRGLGFSEEQLVFALAVFDQLGLIALENGRVRVFRGKKTELANSSIYSAVVRLQEVQ